MLFLMGWDIIRRWNLWCLGNFKMLCDEWYVKLYIKCWEDCWAERKTKQKQVRCYLQHWKSLCGDKTISWSSYLHNGICYTGKTTSSYWIRPRELIFSPFLCTGPEPVVEGITYYPNFEQTVFSLIQDHFQNYTEPLITYAMYELFCKTFGKWTVWNFNLELILFQKNKIRFAFSLISRHWNGAGSWNLSLSKTRTS